MITINKENFSIFLIWLFSISAIIGIYLGHLDWFIPKTPINLLLGAVLLFWNIPIDNFKKVSIWLIAFLVGMFVEILGVQTGVIFGTYYYGENLGLKFMGVPYLIGVNWAVLSFITAAIANHISKNFWIAVVIGASLMVGLDVLLEQLAVVFDFWHFEDGVPPLQNYAAWFIVAFFLQIMIHKTVLIRDINFSLHLFLSQVIFFGLCYLILF